MTTPKHTRPLDPHASFAVDPVTGCHVWQRARNKDGYGMFRQGKRLVYAHTYFWTLANGPVPAGKQLDHKHCQNRACCRADHLEPVTQLVNLRRGRGTKLTPFEALLILRTKGHETARTVAARFGISSGAVYDIWHGRTWADVAAVAP